VSRRDGPLTDEDRAEIAKFKAWLALEAARRDGGDPRALQVAETELYPEGIGREQRGQANDAGARVLPLPRRGR
jgi:hypothetical protein